MFHICYHFEPELEVKFCRHLSTSSTIISTSTAHVMERVSAHTLIQGGRSGSVLQISPLLTMQTEPVQESGVVQDSI